MAQIKRLSHAELDFLRREIRQKFLDNSFHVQELKTNAYLPNYEALQQHMRSQVGEEHAPSIGLARLRKLFYYTNPAACDEKQLKQARFGEDFLDACYWYLSDQALGRSAWRAREAQLEKTGKKASKKKLWVAIGASAATLLFVFAISRSYYPATVKEEAWIETFDTTTLEYLERKGWEILFYDSVLWEKQLRPGYLTIYATPGVFWITEPDSYSHIDNFLLRPVHTDCFTVEIKLVDFHPDTTYEQAGIFLLGSDKAPLPFVNFTKNYGSSMEGINISKLRHSIGTISVLKDKKTITKQLWHTGELIYKPYFLPNGESIDTTWLKVEVRGNTGSFYFRINDKNRAYCQIPNRFDRNNIHRIDFDLPMPIGYVGFGAFGAGSKAYPLILADTTSCLVDEFSFTPCPTN